MDPLLYYIWLSLRCGAGNETASFLLSKFGSPKAIFDADRHTLLSVLPEREGLAAALSDKDTSAAERVLEHCQRANIGIMTVDSPIYPQRLRAIHAKPIVLYYKGAFPNIDEKVAIACVGTRKCSDKGIKVAYKLGADLASAGAVVVSGMARGIDSMCARGALAEKGHTIAVLGCGIDVVYPPENEPLMKAIEQNGTVITEYAPGTPPTGKHFPVRNRIIAGLCLGTVVVEADAGSGALITAEHARKQGKDVFAFPGDVDSNYHSGTNELIAGGATMVRDARDILLEYEELWRGRISVRKIPKNKYYTGEAPLTPIEPLAKTYAEEAAKKKRSWGGKRERKPLPEKLYEEALENAEVKIEFEEERLEEIPKPEKAKTEPSLSGTELLVWRAISGTMSADEIAAKIVRETGESIGVGEVLGALTSLEIEGLCKSFPGGLFGK
ncbi:MAG: DNA-processing protein DprA [Clostridia bacterium]|nr:DNA-processing protein DprA [Clostridia bacterium]